MAEPYHLSIDVGTTYTAAALWRAGRTEPVTLGGSDSAVIPSVVYQSGDEIHVGLPAARRAVTEPGSVAREFKRRVGDPTPMLLGGVAVPAEQLMARMVTWVVDHVTTTEGAPPATVVVTHPASWGGHRLGRLRDAVVGAGVQPDRFVPEPVAAAAFYTAQRRVAPGSVVAVYDLGGGTFDAAVVDVHAASYRLRGRPDGVERLGGIDFDHAVFGHVTQAADIDPDSLDPADPATVAALARLRERCTEAKEALSDTTEVTIPILLPTRHDEVRLSRAELEAMIRPALEETVVALRRAVDSADVAVDDLAAVLLVGGSSRIPLVERLLVTELGRPLAVDARPKHAVAMGAAFLQDQQIRLPPPPPPTGTASSEAHRPWRPVPSPAVRVGIALATVVALVAVAIITGGARSQVWPDRDPGEPPGTDADRSGSDDASEPPAATPIAETYDLSGVTVRIGWLDLTDQVLLANLTEQALAAAGARVVADGPSHPLGVEALHDQLVTGDIDLFWDYMGRPAGIADANLPVVATPEQMHARLDELDRPRGLTWLEPAGYTLGNALVMRREDADELDVSSIADLGPLARDDPDAIAACYVIEESLRSLESTYGFDLTEEVFVPFPDQVYGEVAGGACTVGEVPSAIGPPMVEHDLVVLEDNRGYFTPMNPAPRARVDLADQQPEFVALLSMLARQLDDATMAELVTQVEVDGRNPADVATDWLHDRGLIVE